MMDPQKKATVLHYISSVSGKTVDKLLDLQNGLFYMQVLGLLDQWNKKEETFETDRDRLLCVKKFIQDYYRDDVKIDAFLNFDILLQTDIPQCESDIEFLLAKIAVVLLGVGVLDKNGQHFIGAAMQLPSEMHFDVMAIIQSVVQAGSTEVCLTTSIETVLMEPTDSQSQINAEKLFTWLQTSKNSISLATKEEQVCLQVSPIKLSDDRKSPPICNLQNSHFMDPAQTSTPKDFRYYTSSDAVFQKDSPLRANFSVLGHSMQEITSPLRGLNIDTTSPSSPLAQFVQSPQLAHKAFMKQKELEMRKLQQLLNEQIYLKYELEFNLQDKMSECVNKDAEIIKLQDRIKELLHLRDSYDELQELKSRHSEMEKEMDKLNKKLLGCELYKDQCQHLEKESSSHYEEVEKLHLKIETLEMEASKYRDSLRTVCHLETQVNSLQLQLEVSHKMKTEWEGERRSMQGNLEMSKETVDKLRHELEEMLAKQEENMPGETMGMFMDMQLGELKCQVEELRQENLSLLQQLHELKQTLITRDDELNQQRNSLAERDEVITEMQNVCTSKEQDIQTLKVNADLSEQNIEELKGIISSIRSEIGGLNESTNQKDIQINALESLQCTLKGEIENLKTTIETKDAECSVIMNRVSSLTVKVLELERDLQSQSQEIISLSDTKSNLEEILKMKEEELTGVHKDLLNKSQAITKLETDKATTEEQLMCKEVENDGLCQVNAQMKEETKQVKEQLTAQCAELTELLQLKNTEIMDLMARELSFSETAKYLQTTCNEIRTENEKYKQDIQCRDSELQQARDDKSAGNIQLLSLHEELNRLKASVEEKSSLCKELQDLASQRSHELLIIQSERDQVKNDLTRTENEVRELKECIDFKDDQLQKQDVVKCDLEEQINIMNGQVKDKLEECSEYKDKVTSLSESVSCLEEELQSKSQEMISLSDTKSHLEEALMMKEQELNSVHNDLSHKNEVITALQTDQVTTQEHLRCKEVESNDLCQVNAQLKEEIAQVKEQLTTQSTIVDELTETLNIKNSEFFDLQSQKTSLEDARSTLEISCEELRAKNVRCEQQLNITESELQHITTKLTVQCAAVDELTEALNITRAEVLNVQSQKESLEDELQQIKANLTAGNEELSVMNEEMIRLKASVEEKSSLCKELQDLVSKYSDDLLMLQSERDQVKSDLTNSEIEVKQLKESSHLMTEQLEALHAVKCELGEKINVLDNQIKINLEECSEYNCRVSSLTENVSHLEKELETKNQECTLLIDTKSHLEETLRVKEEELNFVHNDLSHKDEVITKLEADQITVQENLRGKEVESEDLCHVNALLTQEISQIKVQLTEQSTTVDELTETLNIKNAELFDLQSQKKSLEDARSTLEISCEELRAKHFSCEQQLNATESELKHINSYLTARNEELSVMTKELSTLKESVEEKSSLCQELQALASQRSHELLMIQSERDQVKNDLTSSENEVRELKECIEFKDDQLQKQDVVKCDLEEQINILNGQVKDKLEECSEYKDKVTSLSESVSCLEEELQSKSEEMISLSDTKSHLEEALMMKEQELNSVHNDLSHKNEVITALQTDQVITQEHLRCKEVESNDLCQVNAQLKEEIAQVKEQLTTQSTIVDELTETLNIKNAEFFDLQSQKTSLEDARSTLEISCEELRAKNVRCEQQLNITESELQHITTKLTVQCAAVDELTESLNITRAEVLDVQSQKESLEDELQHIKANLTAGNEELSVMNEEMIRLKASVEEKSSLCKDLQDLVSQHSDELLIIQSERDQVKSDLTTAENEAKHLKESTHLMNEQLVSLHAVKCKLEELTNDLKEQLMLKSSSVDELTEALSTKNDDLLEQSRLLKDLTSTVDMNKSIISDLTFKLDQSTNSMTNIKDEIQNKEHYISQLLKTNEEQLGSIADLTLVLQSKESSISELNSELEKQTSANILKTNENAELIHSNARQTEDLRAQLKSMEKELEEKCAMLQKVNEDLLHNDAVMSEKCDELKQSSSDLYIVQEQLINKEATITLLETQLKEVHLSLQDTCDKLADKEKVIVEKNVSEQEMNKVFSALTLSLEERSNEIKIKESVINSLTEQHKTEHAKMKEETENMLNCLQVKFEEARESEMTALATQKADLESQITSLKLDHEAQMSEVAQKHTREISNAESEIACSKEAVKVQLEQQMTSLMEQYEIKIQAARTEHSIKLNRLCEDLKLEQQAQRRMEQELTSQRAIADRLEGTIELRRQEHEKITQKVVEEHEKKISSIEQSHSNKLDHFMAERNTLLEENKKLESQVAELHENATKINKNHQKTVQDLVSQQSSMKAEFEQQMHDQKITMDMEKLAFHESLRTKDEEIANIQAQLAKVQFHIVQLEKKTKALQDENNSFRDRESKILKEGDAQIRTANELNNSLRKQLEVAKKKLNSSEDEIKSVTEQSKLYEVQLTKMKDSNTSLMNAFKIERDTKTKIQKRTEGYHAKYEDLKVIYENLQKENKSYASEVNKLKTSLDYADRKLREYQHQLDQAGTALLGDASHFRQIIEEKHFDSLDDSQDSSSSMTVSKTLRSRSVLSSGSTDRKSNLNETILSGDMVMLKRETLAGSTDLRDKSLVKHQTEDRLSICSTSSSQSIKSLNGFPVACLPNAMSCANEPEGPEFEWDRLSELQRRNTLYLPHMKSAYPVEMQIVNKDKFSDDTLRLSILPNRRGRPSPPNDTRNKRNETSTKASIKEAEAKAKSYKRKAPAQLIMEEMSNESPPKQIHMGPVYHRPGPPTPGKQPRRISGRFTPSHGKSPAKTGKVKLLGSPIARPNPRHAFTPRRSPRLSSPLSSLTEDERRESVAFNIGFTPLKSSGPNRMMRQKGFISTDKPKAATTDVETVHGKGKVGQQTGQVSFSAASRQSVSHEIFHSTCSTDQDRFTLGLYASLEEACVTTQQPTSPKYMLAGKDCVSLHTPVVVSYGNLQTENRTKQPFVKKSVNKVTNLESQAGYRALRHDNLNTLTSEVTMNCTDIFGPRLSIVDDNKYDLNTVTASLSGSVSKLGEMSRSKPNIVEIIADVKSDGSFCDSVSMSDSLQDVLSVLLKSVQKPQHSLTIDLSSAESQKAEKEVSNNFRPEKEQSAANNFSSVSVPVATTTESPSSVQELINDCDVDINKEIPLAKRRLIFAEASPGDELKATDSERELVYSLCNPVLKKSKKKLIIKRAMDFFHVNSRTNGKSKLSISNVDLQKNLAKNLNPNNLDTLCKINYSGVLLAEKKETVPHLPDDTKIPLKYSKLDSEKDAEAESNCVKDDTFKEKFKLSKLMKKAVPFWKKNISKHVASGELHMSTHHENEVDQQAPANLKSEITASEVPGSLCRIETDKILNLGTAAAPGGNKYGSNVAKLREKFEHSDPKEAQINQNIPSAILKGSSFHENVFKKAPKLKALKCSGYQVSPKPKLVATFTDTVETLSCEVMNKMSKDNPKNPDLQVCGIDSASSIETLFGKTSHLHNPASISQEIITPKRNSNILVSTENQEILLSIVRTNYTYLSDNSHNTPQNKKHKLFSLRTNIVTPIRLKKT